MASSIGDIFVTVGARIGGFKQAMGDVSSTLDSTASHAATASGAIQRALSGIAFGGISIGAVAASEKFEAAFAQIQRATGATEEKMKGLEASFANVYKQTAASSEAVATTMSLLSTRTQATGKDLEDLTLKTLKLARTQNEDVAQVVPLVTRAFGDWSIATNQQGHAMDYLRVVSQGTGTSVSRLSEQVVYAGAPLRALGYNFEQATALIGKFEKEGVNTELVLGGMKAALGKFAKDGITDTAKAWRDFVADVKSGKTSFQDVIELVGVKRATDTFKAIQEGRFEIDASVKSFKEMEAAGTKGITTLSTKMKILQHDIETAVAAHKDLVLAVGIGLPAIQAFGGAFSNVGGVVLPVLANIANAIRYDMVGALTTLETAILTGGIAALIAGLAYSLNLLRHEITDVQNPNVPMGDLGHQRGRQVTFGSNGMPSLNPYYVPPSTAPQSPKADPQALTNAAAAKAAEQAANMKEQQAFSALGLQDWSAQISKAKEALDQLVASHKLNSGQMKEASRYIEDLTFKYHLLQQGIVTHPLDLRDLEFRVKLKDLRDEAIKTAQQFREFWGDIESDGAEPGKAFYELLDGMIALTQPADAAKSVIDDLTGSIQRAARAALETSPYGQLADAARYFGITTRGEYDEIAKAATEKYEEMKASGLASNHELTIAHLQMSLDMANADRAYGRISDEEWTRITNFIKDRLSDITGEHKASAQTRARVERALGEELQQEWKSIFGGFERGLATSLIHWKGFGDTFKKLADDLATSTLSAFLHGLFKPMEAQIESLGKKLGDVFGKIWKTGGAATPPALPGGSPTTPGAGPISSVMGAASSGVTGILTAAFTGISALMSVVGMFQNMHQETSLNAIEHNTRYTMMYVGERSDGGILGVMFRLLNEVSFGPGVKVLEQIRDYASKGFGGAGSGSAGAAYSFTNCTFSGLTQAMFTQMLGASIRELRASGDL